MRQDASQVDLVDILEEMLCQRAMKGYRPVIYMSSFIDLECNMLMLLNETAEGIDTGNLIPKSSKSGYHVVMN
ncbi:MAG: hypothetical protein DMF61_00825 [Blastocatellia bacterium AA13]|nr:MAG: hypothetical protein DMF61_00825 [Blastocatellia bacterium AA13]